VEDLLYGFSVALTPWNLLFVLIGVLLGTIVGLLPGLGPTAAVALLLPITYSMDAVSAVILLAGIFYGSMFGGRIPAILLNLPGDGASVVTTFDGYPLRKQGKAGSALGVTAVGGFVGGTIAVIGMTLVARRHGGRSLMLITLGACALLMVGLGVTGVHADSGPSRLDGPTFSAYRPPGVCQRLSVGQSLSLE
jgi:putative tricarboxylic transport membrane protein